MQRSRKQEGGGGNTGSEDDKAKKEKEDILKNKKLQKKFQVAVAKASKKMVAALIKPEKAEVAAADLSLEAAIKRRSGTPVISATSVAENVDALENAEKKFTAQQTMIKLASVKTRLNKMSKKEVTFRG